MMVSERQAPGDADRQTRPTATRYAAACARAGKAAALSSKRRSGQPDLHAPTAHVRLCRGHVLATDRHRHGG